MKKGISALLSVVILVAMVISISLLFNLILSSTFQSQTSISTKSSSSCTQTVKVSDISCSPSPPQQNNYSTILLRFNEGSGSIAVDEAGYDENATVSAVWVQGKFSYGVYFNGENSYAKTTSFVPSPEITVEFWVKPE